MKKIIRTYSELIRLPTFIERYEYLRLGGIVGAETFGYDRYLNQMLYNSYKWRRFRPGIIVRDNGCDLGCEGYEINKPDKVIIHHINPITIDDVLNEDPSVFDPENVICTRHITHMAIHYGDEQILPSEPIVRSRNDTCPWRH